MLPHFKLIWKRKLNISWKSPTDNLNINKRRGRGLWKLFSFKSDNRLSLIIRIASAKSRSARGVSHKPAFMGSCLTISYTCLPSLVFASCISDISCLFFSRKMTYKKMFKSRLNLHSRLRRDLNWQLVKTVWTKLLPVLQLEQSVLTISEISAKQKKGRNKKEEIRQKLKNW